MYYRRALKLLAFLTWLLKVVRTMYYRRALKLSAFLTWFLKVTGAEELICKHVAHVSLPLLEEASSYGEKSQLFFKTKDSSIFPKRKTSVLKMMGKVVFDSTACYIDKTQNKQRPTLKMASSAR